MIALICGTVEEVKEGRLVVGVSQYSPDDKVGYVVFIPQSYEYANFSLGQKVKFWIYSHVREDAFNLYGFLTTDEKELFLMLLSVSGIGPRGALTVLSRVEMTTLFDAIVSGNKDALTEIPGIGKKTAERITIELADTLRKKLEKGEFSKTLKTNSGTTTSPGTSQTSLKNYLAQFADAKGALLGLGYKDHEVSLALKKIQENTQEETFESEKIIKLALKELR